MSHSTSNIKQREPIVLPSNIKTDLDRISNLPGHIVDKILSHLPLKDAVRTSILSSKWRYKWVTLPSLVFDNQSIEISSQDQTFLKNKLSSIIDHILLLHSGPIHKFKLSHRDLQGVSDIDRWILFLSRGNITEFVLEIWKGHRYKLPSSLYSCQKLIHLELFNCLLIPPLSFSGFRSLKSLDLQHITIAQYAFEKMVSNCPLLERLTLMNFEGFDVIHVNAPNLLFFDVGGIFEDVSFCGTYNLAVVSIGLYADSGTNPKFCLGGNRKLDNFFSYIPNIQRLEVQSFFLKLLASGNIPAKLPSPCMELSFLSIRICFNNAKELGAALCILRSSPNLGELEMLSRVEEDSLGGTTVANKNSVVFESIPFNHLRSIKMVSTTCCMQELSFIGFMLENSPVLEKMTVKPASLDFGWDLMKQLLRFRRASKHAEIVFSDPS